MCQPPPPPPRAPAMPCMLWLDKQEGEGYGVLTQAAEMKCGLGRVPFDKGGQWPRLWAWRRTLASHAPIQVPLRIEEVDLLGRLLAPISAALGGLGPPPPAPRTGAAQPPRAASPSPDEAGSALRVLPQDHASTSRIEKEATTHPCFQRCLLRPECCPQRPALEGLAV